MKNENLPSENLRNFEFPNSLNTYLKLNKFLIQSLNFYINSSTNDEKVAILADIVLALQKINEFPKKPYISIIDYHQDEIPIFLLNQVAEGQFEPNDSICTLLKFIEILGYEPFACIEARKKRKCSDFSMFRLENVKFRDIFSF